MAKYEKYTEYKDSGIEALGFIPKDWEVLRGKFLFHEINERSENGDELLLSVSEYYGVKPRGEKIEQGDFLSRAESLEGYKKCYPNDLVMNIMLAWKRGLGISKYAGIVSPAYSVFRFNEKVNPDYIHYLLRTDDYIKYFKTRSTGIIDSRLRLYPESFGDIGILLPDLEDQLKIASFLDHETAQIDTLIAKQEKLIELLKEKRQAVISHAVTKGLDPNVPMKDSGVEWLGQVPEHWTILKLSAIADITRLAGYEYTEYWQSDDEGEIIAIRGQNIRFNKLVNLDDAEKITNKLSIRLKRSRLYKNDIAYPCVGTIGNAVLIHESDKYHINQNIAKLTPNEKIYPLYLTYFLNSSICLESALFLNTSDAQPSILVGNLRKVKIAFPQLAEQIKIADSISNQLFMLDNLILKAELTISLMQERRTALISAAVTGKIDVRNWQAPTVAEADTELSA
ncbi:restriction endonuclease subunit S [Acinetobacter sp. NS4_7]